MDPEGFLHLYVRNIGKAEARRLVLKMEREFKLPFTKVTFSQKGPPLDLPWGYVIAEVLWDPREVIFYKGYLSVGVVVHEMAHLVLSDGSHGEAFKKAFRRIAEKI